MSKRFCCHEMEYIFYISNDWKQTFNIAINGIWSLIWKLLHICIWLFLLLFRTIYQIHMKSGILIACRQYTYNSSWSVVILMLVIIEMSILHRIDFVHYSIDARRSTAMMKNSIFQSENYISDRENVCNWILVWSFSPEHSHHNYFMAINQKCFVFPNLLSMTLHIMRLLK